jgi:hypothetical protein
VPLEAYITDWLSLLLRWAHIVTGIAWIGASFYFIWLDARLNVPPRNPEHEKRRRGSVGGARRWLLPLAEIQGRATRAARAAALVQVGGLFHVDDGIRALRRPVLPERRRVPRRCRVMDMRAGTAVALSVGLLLAAWSSYEILCRAVSGERASRRSAPLLVLATCWGLTHLFSGAEHSCRWARCSARSWQRTSRT